MNTGVFVPYSVLTHFVKSSNSNQNQFLEHVSVKLRALVFLPAEAWCAEVRSPHFRLCVHLLFGVFVIFISFGLLEAARPGLQQKVEVGKA